MPTPAPLSLGTTANVNASRPVSGFAVGATVAETPQTLGSSLGGRLSLMLKDSLTALSTAAANLRVPAALFNGVTVSRHRDYLAFFQTREGGAASTALRICLVIAALQVITWMCVHACGCLWSGLPWLDTGDTVAAVVAFLAPAVCLGVVLLHERLTQGEDGRPTIVALTESPAGQPQGSGSSVREGATDAQTSASSGRTMQAEAAVEQQQPPASQAERAAARDASRVRRRSRATKWGTGDDRGPAPEPRTVTGESDGSSADVGASARAKSTADVAAPGRVSSAQSIALRRQQQQLQGADSGQAAASPLPEGGGRMTRQASLLGKYYTDDFDAIVHKDPPAQRRL